jgi:hypothetical protein
MNINHTLVISQGLESRDFAFVLGLVDMSGDLGLQTPCELVLSYSTSQEVCWVLYVVNLIGSYIFKFSTS